jgi:hypothetical protein
MYDGLPPFLRIGPVDVRIEVLDRLPDDDCWGSHDHRTLLIQLDRTIPSKHYAVDIVLHETMHALYRTWHIDDKTEEEGTVSCLATGLTQVLRDNPQLLNWIQRSLQDKSPGSDTQQK